MGFLDWFMGNRLGPDDPKDQIRWREKHIATVQKEIEKIEKQKKDLFKQGVGADDIKKRSLAQKIKQLDRRKTQLKEQRLTMNEELMFISNRVVIKQYEKELKQTPIWDKLKNIEPSALWKGLINVDLRGKSFVEVLNILNKVLESALADSDSDQSTDDFEKQLLDAWSNVEPSAIDFEEEQKIVSTEKQIEQKDPPLEDEIRRLENHIALAKKEIAKIVKLNGFLVPEVGTTQKETTKRLKLNELSPHIFSIDDLIKKLLSIQKFILRSENYKNEILSQGISADFAQKKMIFLRLKQLDEMVQSKYKTFMTMNKQYLFISNLLILKQYEKEFKQTPVWDKIKNIEPSKFEKIFINVDLKGKSYEEVLNIMNDALESSLADSDSDQSTDDAEKQIE